jgi:hypothetical protein
MKKIAIIAAVLLLVGAVGSVSAATQMRIGAVTGLISADTAKAGDSVRINIEWVNGDAFQYNPSLAFRIFSRASMTSGDYGSGTATWVSTPAVSLPPYYTLSSARPRTGPQVDTSGGLPKAEFGGLYLFNCFGCDGQGVDTIAFAAAANDAAQTAIPANDSGIAFRLLLVTTLADTGKVICIDSSQKFPPTNTWKWAPFNAPTGTPYSLPDWTGIKCWYLKDPSPAGVNDVTDGALPTNFDLKQNYPNPFNPSTTIRFDVPRKSHIKLTVYNVLGQAVATLVDEDMAPGKKEATWDGASQTGVKVSSGTYFYKIVADDFVSTKKMLLLK